MAIQKSYSVHSVTSEDVPVQAKVPGLLADRRSCRDERHDSERNGAQEHRLGHGHDRGSSD
jgi:hypothetical protein